MSALTVSYGECSELIEKLQADKDAHYDKIFM